MNAEERRNLYRVYKEDVRAMAYLYVETVREAIRALPPNVGDFTTKLELPERIWPRRAYYPRTTDLFHEVALILSREHQFRVKWRRVAPQYIYLCWMDKEDIVTDIDDVPARPVHAPARFAPSRSLPAPGVPGVSPARPMPQSGSGDWLAGLRAKLDKKNY